jgi:ABC-2 type transport system ATP-binding protein
MSEARDVPDAGAGAPLLVVRDASRAFGDRRAVAGVTFELRAGEIVLLVGANGAGKTTLLRLITGYLDADAGEVRVGGAVIDVDRAAAQRCLGYLPEHAPAPPELLVREHLRLRARLKRASPASIERAVAATTLGDVIDRRIGTLSKGFRQRVGLADALLGEPALLVLDEPTSGMDPIQVRQLREQIAAAGRAVLMSSHAVTDLAPIASRVIVLRAGRILADATPAALIVQTAAPRLEDAVIALLGEGAAA